LPRGERFLEGFFVGVGDDQDFLGFDILNGDGNDRFAQFGKIQFQVFAFFQIRLRGA
jgi:hypothetical protein